jgi:predicted O-methyltransferase YrrM
MLDEYILQHSTPEHPYLHQLYRATNIHLIRPRMASGHAQGILLKMLTELINPETVVEIGTYSGYSALSMAQGMKEGSQIYTFEINDEQEDFTRPWLENSPFPPQINMIIGDVFKILPTMNLKIDLAFIDANKRTYVEYYNLIMRYLNVGGYILADNTLWDGHVVEEAYNNDPQTVGIKNFNDLIARDERVEKFIFPLRDGLTLIKKIKD